MRSKNIKIYVSQHLSQYQTHQHYAAILAEMEHWKEKFYDLQAQISELRQVAKDTVIIKESGTFNFQLFIYKQTKIS
jgi:chaperonin cofactor prefoldin